LFFSKQNTIIINEIILFVVSFIINLTGK
jgi:hypothetical protein